MIIKAANDAAFFYFLYAFFLDLRLLFSSIYWCNENVEYYLIFLAQTEFLNKKINFNQAMLL